MTDPGLTVAGLTVKRGGLTICDDVSLDVPTGEVTVLLGANGAGKSTLLDGVAGVLPGSSGQVRLASTRIDRWPRHRRARAGLGYVEQGRTVFSRLTVAQNILVADPGGSSLREALEMFPQLREKVSTRAGLLSGGEQQMLLIARAMARRPRILMIDELSLGLAPRVVSDLMTVVADLARAGTGVLLVEQFASLALKIGTTAHLLERGRIARTESCSQLLQYPSILENAYLGNASDGELR